MRRQQKRQIKEFLCLLEEAHASIRKALRSQKTDMALSLLAQCQQGAVSIGTLIESMEGEGVPAVSLLEDYCEQVYQCCEAVQREDPAMSGNRLYRELNKRLSGIKKRVEEDLKARTEVVFFPYKASMWDSLESVWQAADAAPDCDAYVVPIPYYDRNPDGSLGQYHYEGGMYPPDVPVVDYRSYSLEERRPDIAYIHNPYDDCNLVTTVDPEYYSANLKRYVDLLVYIPYYSTSGGMAESQRSCPAYYYADYIIIQAEKYRGFFDAALPKEKLVPLGSPKFDRVIRMCANPPEPPEAWKEQMAGRKVYFYNTSIGGMLNDTEKFLKKVEYVFRCFEGRKDACLLWRPHPLLESTFDSMRPQFRPFYDALKARFVERGLGIYDDSPDITSSIALSDAYIGESGSSVISLFGIAGKPVFIFNNNIIAAPKKDDWRGGLMLGVPYEQQDWLISCRDQVYYAPGHDFEYRFCCNLSKYLGGGLYSKIINIGGRHFACPASAQDILEISEHGIQKRVALYPFLQKSGAFAGAEPHGKYIVLIPNNYPAIVRYNIETDEICYYTHYLNALTGEVNGTRRAGGFCVQGEYLYIASPTNNKVLTFHIPTGKTSLEPVKTIASGGCIHLVPSEKGLWMLPWSASGELVLWNPKTGDTSAYPFPKIRCVSPYNSKEAEEKPFSYGTTWGKYVYFSPAWSEDFVRLDQEIGEISVWKPPFNLLKRPLNGYYAAQGRGYFLDFAEGSRRRYFSTLDRKLYDIDLAENTFEEIPMRFSLEELRDHEPGFAEQTPWLQYACKEDEFNSLSDFLSGHISGTVFDQKREISAYSVISANPDGTCGEKTHRFIQDQLEKKHGGTP